jgi:hypothetical protein
MHMMNTSRILISMGRLVGEKPSLALSFARRPLSFHTHNNLRASPYRDCMARSQTLHDFVGKTPKFANRKFSSKSDSSDSTQMDGTGAAAKQAKAEGTMPKIDEEEELQAQWKAMEVSGITTYTFIHTLMLTQIS